MLASVGQYIQTRYRFSLLQSLSWEFTRVVYNRKRFLTRGAVHFSDYSPYHASIAAYGFNINGTSGETVAFVWKGSSNNNIYTGSWQDGWINTSSRSDTTYYAPAINRDYTYLNTAFTGTNTVVYYDL